MKNPAQESKSRENKNLIFFVIAMLTVGTVFYILYAIRKPVDIRKEKAAETQLSLTMSTASQTINVGDTFSVELKIDTKADTVSAMDLALNYDENKLNVDSITLGSLFPVILRPAQTDQGKITFALGCDPASPVKGTGVIATVVFTAAEAGQTMLQYDQSSQVAALGQNTSALKLSSGGTVTIAGGTGTQATPTPGGSSSPTPGGNQLTPTPTGGNFFNLTPTPTGTASGNSRLNIKAKFQGILSAPVEAFRSQMVKIGLKEAGGTELVTSFVNFGVDGNLVWSGSSLFDIPRGTYDIFIKGPKHIQKKVTRVTIGSDTTDIDTTDDFILVGDLPPQDGIINSYDLSLIRNNLGKKDQATLDKADLNYDGIVDTQDYSLAIVSLSNREADEVN